MGSTRSEVTAIYDAQRVGEGNIDDRGDRYFVTFADEGGSTYKLRFFFNGSTDSSAITEIDIMKSVL